MLAIAAVPAGTLKPCVGFESRLRVVPSVVASGETPRFVLELANPGRDGVRLLDVRDGRRTDLADTYYRLVVSHPDGAPVRGARQISDPGPISVSDFFVLQPGARISVTLRSLVSLPGLGPGAYQAYAAIWTDPYSAASICRSGGARFRVE